ncbi:hypothetical protein IQ07DRAFT_369958 [Pyrenochaeta sp. DS3sAY3a]|nr:hypothetical protein IQ07DRAFT_369958 [Pyrenochaeta sp. DS3sAY3a]
MRVGLEQMPISIQTLHTLGRISCNPHTNLRCARFQCLLRRPQLSRAMRSLSMPASTSTANSSTMIGDLSFPDAIDTHFKTSYGDNLPSNYAPITHSNWASWPAVESSSPMLQASSNFSYPGQSIPPSNTTMTNQWGMSAQNTGNLSTRNSWSSYDSNQSFQQPLEPSNPYIVRASQSPMVSPGMITTPSVLGIPPAVPIGQPRGQMPPPTNSVRRPIAPRKQSKELEGNNLDQPQRSASVPKKAKRPKAGGPQQNERPFIHAICGKSFGTRYRVKKHHWGVKVDDLDTETGCWADRGKPNVDWDAHPSCSEAPATRKAKKPAAKVIQKEKEGEDQTSQDMGSYHSHRMPSQDSFDTLLSAVNMVAHIDMPKPHNQNESAASHLESQVLAMEDQMPQTSASFDAQGGKEPDESEHGSHLLRANGSQMYPPEHESWQKFWSASNPPKTTATNDHINSNPLKRGSMSFESDFLDSSEKNGKARKMSKE